MKNKKKRIILTILLTVVSIVFLLPVIGFCILNWGILPPHKLTPLVVKEANKYLNGELSCDKIELTFFETYPFLGVRITDGLLLSHVGKEKLPADSISYFREDTLLQFKQVVLSVNPVDYLKGEVITIKEVIIREPGFYGFVDEEGTANWDILLVSGQEDATDESSEELPPVDLQKVRIRNGHFIYDDRQADLFTEIQGFSLRLNGSLVNGGNKLAIQTKSSAIFFDSPSYTLNSKLELQLKSNLSILDNFNTIQLDKAELLVNNLPFTAAGRISNVPDSNRLQIDMNMALTISDMNDILPFIPDEYFKERKNIKANGSIVLEGNIHGELGDSIVPTINLCTKVSNGSFFMKGVKQGIELFEMDMDMHLKGTSPDSSFIVLDKLRMEGLNTSIHLEGKVMELLGSPSIDAKLKGKIDFTRLAEEFLNPDTLLLNGYMDADIIASFTMDDIVNGRYNNIRATGSFSIDRLRAFSKPTRTSLFIRNASFFVDSARQTSSYIAGDDLLSATLKIDSLAIRHKKEINTMLGGVDITAKTSSTIDTTAVTPLTTHIKIETLRSRLPDSVWVVASKAYLRGGIKPSASNKQLPTIGASITIDTLKYVDIPLRTGTTLAGNTFNLEALPYRDAMRQQRQRQQARRESTTASRRTQPERVRQQRDSTVRRQVATDTTQTNSGGLLRNWEVRGSLSFHQMRMFSRMFPLPVRMDQTSLKFNTNTITLTDANLHAGKSNFLLNGELTGLRRAMLRGGKLEGKLSVNSEYIDCNQLMRTISRAMAYTEQLTHEELAAADEGQLDTLEAGTLDTIAEVQQTDTTDLLFVVPAFLDVNLVTNAKKIHFQELELENVTGEMVVRNQSINLKRLDMHSNIGHGNLTMVYTARDAYEASAGFELDMQDILVDKLIGLFPSIDTLVPMLRSFEGVVDCQITATCQLDSTMSVILPSVQSACYMYGQNMVLLDGETFSEISKTLMFKNKERNQIDSISVDLAIRDNKIEVYPFLIEMDRYKVAVGGTHHMDMTFNYHLSVLKSPVPFKLGLDISGNLDKFKYKITKCRYKDLFKPAKIAELDSTRSNVRNEIREVIRKKIYENAPELAGDLNYREMRRRIPVVADPDPDGELPEEDETTG